MSTRTGVAPLPNVDVAFARCRQIARREAKNFYFAFMALPRAKSDAMCAMYAFMRRADDIADDESMAVSQRRALMQQWLGSFHADAALDEQDSLVFAAVRETQRRFGIDDVLLEELVAGTAMDLAETLPAGVVRVPLALARQGGTPGLSGKSQVPGAETVQAFDCYESVEALDRYCYLVASVVGLVTVRIFGVSGSSADDAAVRMGKAFQYTNILRDVKEDAERGRVYLPLDVLRAHGAALDDVAQAASGSAVTVSLQGAMAAMGARAEDFYGARHELLPLLARDSRPAMRVLIRIYHVLLLKMRRRKYRVFEQRVSVSIARKLLILLRGMVGSVVGRIV